MADLLIKGIRELTVPHTIHVGNVGLDGVKEAFKAWDSAVGCAYDVVELPPEENRLYVCDPSKADGCSKTGCAYTDRAERGDCMLTTRLEWALMEVQTDGKL